MINTNKTVGLNEAPDQRQNIADDEIDLAELFRTLWAGKWIIISVTLAFAVVTAGITLMLPNQYKASVILAAAQKEGGGGLSGLAAQYGGLAAMAGINLGKDSGKLDQAVELLKSWSFIDAFVNKYQIKPEVMAVERWDKNTDQLIYRTNKYDPSSKAWVGKNTIDDPAEPSSWKTYKRISKLMTVALDAKSGLLTISVQHYSPAISAKWASLLAKELNQHFQRRDIAESKNNIAYLQKKISETSLAEMQSVFYGMIESQTKTLMLAEVSDEYLVKTVVPAMVPEEKSTPKRALIVLAALFFGFALSVVVVLVRGPKGEKSQIADAV